MKKLIIILFVLCPPWLIAQNNKKDYPTPEYSNEIYFFIRDSATLSRLEKGESKMKSKSKMGGMGGGEQGYALEGSKSNIRLESGRPLYFIFFMNESSGNGSSPSDSLMEANGMDNASRDDALSMMNDPSKTTSLYKMNIEKGSRNITVQSYSGMKILGKSKNESTRYTLSFKKIRYGYYEFVVDKMLPKGEYAFLLMDMSAGMDGSMRLFAFGVD